MRPPCRPAFWLVLATGLANPASAPPLAAAATVPETLVDQLDAAIRDAIALARDAQQHERAIDRLERDIGEGSGAGNVAANQRAFEANKARQTEVLDALVRLARTPPEAALLLSERPIDRMRSGLLVAAALPALAGEARQLSVEIDTLSRQRTLLADRQAALAQNRQELAAAHAQLAEMAERRAELRRQLGRDDPDAAERAAKIGSEAADLPDLIKRAEAERRDRDLRPRRSAAGKARAEATPVDPTRPKNLRSFDSNTTLVVPVMAPIGRRFGESDPSGAPSQGVGFAAQGGAAIVAPFDGRIVYAGRLQGYGPILIIAHGGGYHSVIAGLGRIDARIGEWVVAGEPVGAAPDPAKPERGVTVYYELRRDGRPIDPQLSPATR